MISWRVSATNGSDYEISGEALPDAIAAGFDRIRRDLGLGNAAGVHLVSVTGEYRAGILGGRGGVEVVIEHQGLDLAHRPANDEARTSKAWVYAQPEDAPEPFTVSLTAGTAV
ncbi:MAG: hypothetical protein M0R75_13615 [Dehalococcoidia bacterium]|nr:hypothetical protein [Dehalococcoidia bacterium]